MDMHFNGSENLTIGVELELQLIDPTTRNLTSGAMNILKECQKAQFPRVKKEVHQSMLEVDTPICQSVKECRQHLDEALNFLFQIAEGLNIKCAISGTHPFQQWSDRRIFPAERFLFFYRKYRWLAKRITVYGLHVHIGVETGDEAIAVMNGMIQYLPYLLALSSSSPFWGGKNTGVSSCRLGIMESFPYAGIPPYFANWTDFSIYYNLLHQTKAISSLKDLYWHIRPNPTFGTVEFRICDGMPTLTETMALVALIQCLVARSKEESSSSTHFHRLIAPENLWRAARDGLKALLIVNKYGHTRPITEEICSLMESLKPFAKELDCEEELSFIHQMIAGGSSADRQRRVFRKTNSLISVVDSIVEELQSDIHQSGEVSGLRNF